MVNDDKQGDFDDNGYGWSFSEFCFLFPVVIEVDVDVELNVEVNVDVDVDVEAEDDLVAEDLSLVLIFPWQTFDKFGSLENPIFPNDNYTYMNTEKRPDGLNWKKLPMLKHKEQDPF